MKKGDKVKLNLDSLIKNIEKELNLMKKSGIKNPKHHSAFTLSNEHREKLIHHAKSENIGIIMSVHDKNSINEYCDIKFNDGFECGGFSQDLIKINI